MQNDFNKPGDSGFASTALWSSIEVSGSDRGWNPQIKLSYFAQAGLNSNPVKNSPDGKNDLAALIERESPDLFRLD